MLETVIGIIAATGIVGVFIAAAKWLIKSIGTHEGTLTSHVATLDRSFNIHTERLLSGLESVRREVSGVKEALFEHTVEEMDTWRRIEKRLDGNEHLNRDLVTQVHALQGRLDRHLANGSNGHGISHLDDHVKLGDE